MVQSTRRISTRPILTRCPICQTWQPVAGFTFKECPNSTLFKNVQSLCFIFDTLTGPMPSGQLRTMECPPQAITDTPSQEPSTSDTVPQEHGYTRPNSETSFCNMKWECSMTLRCSKHGYTLTTERDRSNG